MADKRLEPQTFDSVEEPDEIRSGILGPCIAIGVFNCKSRKAYMLHVGQPDASTLPQEFFSTVSSENRTSDLSVYVTGGSYDSRNDEDEKKDLRAARKFIKETIHETFEGARIKINWGKLNHVTELYCSTEDGKFRVASLPDD